MAWKTSLEPQLSCHWYQQHMSRRVVSEALRWPAMMPFRVHMYWFGLSTNWTTYFVTNWPDLNARPLLQSMPFWSADRSTNDRTGSSDHRTHMKHVSYIIQYPLGARRNTESYSPPLWTQTHNIRIPHEHLSVHLLRPRKVTPSPVIITTALE